MFDKETLENLKNGDFLQNLRACLCKKVKSQVTMVSIITPNGNITSVPRYSVAHVPKPVPLEPEPDVTSQASQKALQTEMQASLGKIAGYLRHVRTSDPFNQDNKTINHINYVPDADSISKGVIDVLLIPHHKRTRTEINFVVSSISNLPALSKCTKSILTELCSVCRLESYKNVIFNQGDAPFSWYIVLQGAVDILINKIGAEGNMIQIKVATLKYGQGFGELALVNSNPRSATVKCQGSSCLLMVIDKEDYLRTVRIAHNHDVAEKTKFLCSIPECEVLPESIIQNAANVLKWRILQGNELILEQNSHLSEFFIIKTGYVDIYRNLEVNNQIVKVRVCRKGPREYFGEEWVIYSSFLECFDNCTLGLTEKEKTKIKHQFLETKKDEYYFPSLISARTFGVTELGCIQIHEAQSRMSNFFKLSNYFTWEEKAIHNLYLEANAKKEWKKTKKRILKQMRLK